MKRPSYPGTPNPPADAVRWFGDLDPNGDALRHVHALINEFSRAAVYKALDAVADDVVGLFLDDKATRYNVTAAITARMKKG